jgi:hypothetical protein
MNTFSVTTASDFLLALEDEERRNKKREAVHE